MAQYYATGLPGKSARVQITLELNKKKSTFSSQMKAIIFGRALNSLLVPQRLSVIILSFVLSNKTRL